MKLQGAVIGYGFISSQVMCFSAVYLNHHYLLDILWGSAYALLVCYGLEWWARRESKTYQCEVALPLKN